MTQRLYLTLPQLPDPRARILWDALAIRLDIEWIVSRHALPQASISDGHRTLVVPIFPPAPIQLQQLQDASGAQYALLAKEPLRLRPDGSDWYLNADVITPLQRLAALMFEDGLRPRAADGTLAGTSYAVHNFDAVMLGVDYIGELAALISSVLQSCPSYAWHAIAPQAPYAVIMTFDCDGFLPGQPGALRSFLEKHQVVKPTVFVMAPDSADVALYDPRYDPADPELRPLYEISEIGLHSSYRAYNDRTRMAAQKARLEDVVGSALQGHRSHYLRFGFPYTWGYVAQAGFSYDMTMGFYDLPGYRQGGSQPLPLADPAGRGRMLWSWGVGLMDQHLFMPGSPLAWRDGAGKAALANRLAQLRKTGGTLVLDWHVHAIGSDQFPQHFVALEWLLEEARRDGAWIGGAGVLLEQYRVRHSARHLVAQTSIVTKAPATLVNQTSNTGHYVQGARSANLLSVNYIDAGSHSFLAALPNDAMRVVDVGCGSGWVSNRVPPLRQVLGIDIDEGITDRISRRGMVGSLPDLPLQDAQSDLVLCTDVIEHLTSEQVLATGIEFDRVSTRYVYLQTPHRERLVDSECHCRACGARWHISHHVGAHDVATLSRVMPNNWYTHTVTYTGELQLVDSSLRNSEGETLGPHPMLAQPYVCTSCGHVNQPQQAEPDLRLAMAHSKERLPLPFYSEVAVMAANAAVFRQWDDSQPMVVSRQGTQALLPVPYYCSSHVIDFRQPVEEVASVANTYHIPCVVLQDGTMQCGSAGTELVASGLADAITLLMLFPDQHPAGQRFVIRGQALSTGPAMLTLQGFNWALEDCGSTQAVVDGEFLIQLSLERPAYCVALYVNSGDRVCLHQAGMIDGDPRPLLLYDLGTRYAYGHVQLQRRGTQWRWLVPAHGRLWTDRPFQEQLGENRLHEPSSVVSSDSVKLARACSSQALLHALLNFALEGNRNMPQSTGVDVSRCYEVQSSELLVLPQGPLLAILAFSAVESEMLLIQKRSPIARLLLRYDRRIGAVLRRILPLTYYRKLRTLYPRVLRRLTK